MWIINAFLKKFISYFYVITLNFGNVFLFAFYFYF